MLRNPPEQPPSPDPNGSSVAEGGVIRGGAVLIGRVDLWMSHLQVEFLWMQIPGFRTLLQPQNTQCIL